MFKSIGLQGNLRKKALLPVSSRIIDWCRRRDIRVHVEDRLYDQLPRGKRKSALVKGNLKKTELICVLGGDGFLLFTVRSLYPLKTPILPVNIGSLGFHTQTDSRRILQTLRQFHEKGFSIDKRYLLRIDQGKRAKRAIAFNDVLLVKETRSRMIHLEVELDGVKLGRVACDGMIVSTSTGSTAYNLSSGGPLIHPSLPVVSIIPLCPHSLNSRAMVLPRGTRIQVRFTPQKDREETLVCLDGQIWWPLPPGEAVVISIAPKPVFIATDCPEQYYRKIRTRFNWGIPPKSHGD